MPLPWSQGKDSNKLVLSLLTLHGLFLLEKPHSFLLFRVPPDRPVGFPCGPARRAASCFQGSVG